MKKRTRFHIDSQRGPVDSLWKWVPFHSIDTRVDPVWTSFLTGCSDVSHGKKIETLSIRLVWASFLRTCRISTPPWWRVQWEHPWIHESIWLLRETTRNPRTSGKRNCHQQRSWNATLCNPFAISPRTLNYNRKWPVVGIGSDKGSTPECKKYCACACKTPQKHAKLAFGWGRRGCILLPIRPTKVG